MLKIFLILALTLSRPSNRAGECVTGIPPMIVPCPPDTTPTTTTIYHWTPPQVPATSNVPPPVEGHPYTPPSAIQPATANTKATREKKP